MWHFSPGGWGGNDQLLNAWVLVSKAFESCVPALTQIIGLGSPVKVVSCTFHNFGWKEAGTHLIRNVTSPINADL